MSHDMQTMSLSSDKMTMNAELLISAFDLITHFDGNTWHRTAAASVLVWLINRTNDDSHEFSHSIFCTRSNRSADMHLYANRETLHASFIGGYTRLADKRSQITLWETVTPSLIDQLMAINAYRVDLQCQNFECNGRRIRVGMVTTNKTPISKLSWRFTFWKSFTG